MAITLERIIDKIEAQWPLYAGIGVVGYVAYTIIKGLQSKKKASGGARMGTVEGGGGYEGGGVSIGP